MTAKEFLFQLNHHRTCIATYGQFAYCWITSFNKSL